MKIAFWSNSYEQSRVTYNLAAVSVASVMRYPYTIAVLENNLHKDNLGLAYLGTDRVMLLKEAGNNYYDGGGIEGLLRQIYRDSKDRDLLKPYLKEIIRNHLYYIPQSRFIHNELFDYELTMNADTLFHILEENFDLSFVDTSPYHLNSKTILETADLIVVNLCQNHYYLEDFFHNYSSLIPKAVFLIGNYTPQTIWSARRISRLYDIPIEDIVPIPYSDAFENSFARGRAIEFMTSNYLCAQEHPDYLFIKAVRRAAAMIMKKSVLSGMISKKEVMPCGR